MAKLFYGPDHGTITVREDDDVGDLKNEIEITAEQATAISLSGIKFAVAGICEALDEHLPGLKP